jgi:hypothetical protein
MKSKALYFEKETVCKNCGSTQINNYCCNCGQKVYTKRFTIKSFFFVILNTLSLERGFFYTAKMLFTHPGKVVNEYINGKTRLYYNPLKYIIIIAGIYAFLTIYLNILDANIESNEYFQKNVDSLQNSEELLQMQEKWMDIFKQYINLIPLLLVPFTSLVSKWFYRSKKLFYGEHLVINCFIFAQIFILYILWSPVAVIIPSLITYFPLLTFISSIIYLCYALYSIFHESPFRAIMGGMVVYFLGMLLFFLFFLIIVIIFGAIFVLPKI